MKLPSQSSYIINERIKSLSDFLNRRDPEFQIILLIGPHGSGKTLVLRTLYDSDCKRFRYVNLSLLLSEKLMNLSFLERRLDFMDTLNGIMTQEQAEILLIDNIELLFDLQLATDPIKCLVAMRKLKKPIVVAWTGTYDKNEDTITYADINHPEFTRYRIRGICTIFQMIDGVG